MSVGEQSGIFSCRDRHANPGPATISNYVQPGRIGRRTNLRHGGHPRAERIVEGVAEPRAFEGGDSPRLDVNFLLVDIASSVRFSVGWYAALCFALIGSCTLLGVLLIETTLLYSRLASAIIVQRGERANRLLSVDALTASIAMS
ncbi:MAG: twocomponent sensor histidine kinase [Bradyrhizobium sp.]|nr:twocomponent sensor histidine kinase [Bradyrhizobium sp.]